MEQLTFKPIKFVKKGWGHELIIVNKDYCGKLLFFNNGKKCSWHYHKVKDEVFFLAQGSMIVHYSWGDDITKAEETLLQVGMHFEVPTGLRHQMVALEDSHLYEFSTTHCDEDSLRIIKGD